jgi:hypothetical protein
MARLACLVVTLAACRPPPSPAPPAIARTAAPVEADDRFELFAFAIQPRTDGGEFFSPIACRRTPGGAIEIAGCGDFMPVDAKLRSEEGAHLRRSSTEPARCDVEWCALQLEDSELYVNARWGRFAAWPPTWGLELRHRKAVRAHAPVPPEDVAALDEAVTAAIADRRLPVRDPHGESSPGDFVAWPVVMQSFAIDDPHYVLYEVVATAGDRHIHALFATGDARPPAFVVELVSEGIADEPHAIALEPGVDLLWLSAFDSTRRCRVESVVRFDGHTGAKVFDRRAGCD